MENKQDYIALINQLSQLYRKIDIILMHINRYEITIKNGLILNGNTIQEFNLTELKETLIYKKNKIRNEFIPIIQTYLYN